MSLINSKFVSCTLNTKVIVNLPYVTVITYLKHIHEIIFLEVFPNSLHQ